MNLPREIRDMIWRHVVLSLNRKIRVSFKNIEKFYKHETVPLARRSIIDLTVRDDTSLMSTWPGPYLKISHTILGPLDGPVPLFDHSLSPASCIWNYRRLKYHYELGTYFSPRIRHDDWKGRLVTGGLFRTTLLCEQPAHSHPDLTLFHTCRQICDEAREIYYKEHTFVFCVCQLGRLGEGGIAMDCRGGMGAIHAALTLLTDRPKACLRHIRNIELHLHVYSARNAVLSTEDFDPALMAALMDKLTSPGMGRIRHLSLKLSGHLPEPVDTLDSSRCSPVIQQLLRLSGVARLTIRRTSYTKMRSCDMCPSTWSWRPPSVTGDNLASMGRCRHHKDTLKAAAFIKAPALRDP